MEDIMSLLTLFITAVGLSMDAFAVAICKGLAMKKLSWKKALIIGLWFGGFQALMPTIGYLLGTRFESYVTAIDHWIAFVLLVLIGANMVKESFSKEEESSNDSVDFKTMFLLAIAPVLMHSPSALPMPSCRSASFPPYPSSASLRSRSRSSVSRSEMFLV